MVELNREILEQKYGRDWVKELISIEMRNERIIKINANAFKGLVKLEELYLYNNEIVDIEVKSFQTLSNLKVLYLSHNKLKRIDASVFKGLVILEELRLHNNEITDIDVKAFETLSNLKDLHLFNNKLKRIDSNVFKGLAKLEILYLNENEITDIDVKAFETLSNLNKLYLSHNKLKRIDSSVFKGLAQLEFLRLYGNEITYIDVNAFETLSNLKQLHLFNNKLKRIDSNVFKGLTKLETLDLNENEITDIDVKAFEALSNLKWLSISKNKLKRIDSNVFKGLTKLATLFLGENEIVDIGVKAFETLSNLKVLNLSKNKLNKLDRKCLEPLKSIHLLGIYGNVDLKALSFYIPQAKTEEYLFDELKLAKSEFLCNWNDFLKQFPNIEGLQSQSLEEQIESLMNTTRVRRVINDNISSLCITIDSNREGLIGELIDRKYKIEGYLGIGGFGKVYKVMDLNDNNIKVIKLIKSMDDDEWVKEPMLLSRLNHKHIVKYVDHLLLISKDKYSHPCIFTEYCQNGDLASLIQDKKQKNERFEDKTILNWIYEATDGVRYLHKLKVIHRDIKPANMLLTNRNVLKLADLGTAKVMLDTIRANTKIGTIEYMSPELKNFKDYSFSTDIWSLGCVLYELVFLKLASNYRGMEKTSTLFSSSIRRMLAELPNERISAQKLYEDFEKLKEILDL